MTNLANLKVHIGQLKSGQWVAATGVSPYFCVEAESEQAVKSLAKEAIDFYRGVLEAHGGELPVREQTFTQTITAAELVAA